MFTIAIESKAEIEEYGRSKASDNFKLVAVQAGFYDSDMLHQGMIKKQPDGSWALKLPISADKTVPTIDIEEYGLWVRAVIEHPELRDDGRAIPATAEDVSLRKMAEGITKATGTDIKVIDNLSFDEFAKTFPEGTPPHVIEDAGVDIYRVFDTYGYFQGVDTVWPHKYLAKKPSTYEEWLARADLSEYKN